MISKSLLNYKARMLGTCSSFLLSFCFCQSLHDTVACVLSVLGPVYSSSFLLLITLVHKQCPFVLVELGCSPALSLSCGFLSLYFSVSDVVFKCCTLLGLLQSVYIHRLCPRSCWFLRIRCVIGQVEFLPVFIDVFV